MIVTVFLLLHSLTSVTGSCSMGPEVIYVQGGEMGVLLCPFIINPDHSNTTLVWTGYTVQGMTVMSDMSLTKQKQMGVLVHGRSLVILSASAKDEGNYSCSLGHDRITSCQPWFQLTVYNAQSTEIQGNKHRKVCFKQESCQMECPTANIPDEKALNISSSEDVVWHKEGKLINSNYFSAVEPQNQGNYTCTRMYQYDGHLYNTSVTVELEVRPRERTNTETITFPADNAVFEVELGAPAVIDCKALVYLESDEVFWLSDSSFVERNESFPVYYNYSEQKSSVETKVTASLVFKNVSEEDLSRRYMCKLDSTFKPSYATISLVRKARPSYVSLIVIIVCIVVVTSVTVVVYVKFRIDIVLFLRDSLGCHGRPSGGQSYDAFLLCYNSDKDAGMTASDRRWLEGVLETSYGYSLCVWERDMLPGGAEAEAVLECIEKSKAVVLVPTSLDSDPGSGLLSAIHAALVERQSRLVFIKTEPTRGEASDPLPETLQHLSDTGEFVTWKGMSSMTTSSSFFKQLRYYLPAPQHPPNVEPETMQDVTVW